MSFPPEILQLSRRDRWASRLAAVLLAVHMLTIWILFRWYYDTARQWKWDIEGFKIEVTQAVQLLIRQSDMVVNYWYLLILAAPPFFIADFLLMRWMGKQIGLRWTLICGIGIALVFVVNMAYGQFLFSKEFHRLKNFQWAPMILGG